MNRLSLFAIAGLVFAVLATANAAGYRYGTSDQAFYVPAVTRALEPAAFPRDAALIDAQAHLIVVDEVLAGIARATGWSMQTLFFGGYLLSLALTWAGLAAIGTRLYASTWTTLALGAAFAMRHRISQTSANSFEPYFHPRMLAFALGLLAIAAVLRRRHWAAVALVAVSSIIHLTTALWFATLLGVALAILDRTFRRLAYITAIVGGAGLVAAIVFGPLRSMWVTMDAVWLQAVASKDSLFADQWPLWAWVGNLGLLLVLWAAVAFRRTRGTATTQDTALAWGATALVALFLLTLPFVVARRALVVEFQISRVFWLVDLLATVYALAAIDTLATVATSSGSRRRAPMIATVLLFAVAASRGIYIMLVEHPERDLVAIDVPPSPWEDAMRWVAAQPLDVQVLADPGHAWKFGTSVRVSGGHDVFLEEQKDSAIAIYSHDVAARVVERTAAIGDFPALTADRARALAAQYALDLLVSEADMPLPVLYRNRQFTIYALRPRPAE